MRRYSPQFLSTNVHPRIVPMEGVHDSTLDDLGRGGAGGGGLGGSPPPGVIEGLVFLSSVQLFVCFSFTSSFIPVRFALSLE